MGEGECRQADGGYGLQYSDVWSYTYLNPHTDGDNADKATTKCLKQCYKYSWCYAAEVVLKDDWLDPRCRLITDRATFEKAYGPDQDYTWGAKKTIDRVSYSTYCDDGNSACREDQNYCHCKNYLKNKWGGGSFFVRKEGGELQSGSFCYKKTGM